MSESTLTREELAMLPREIRRFETLVEDAKETPALDVGWKYERARRALMLKLLRAAAAKGKVQP